MTSTSEFPMLTDNDNEVDYAKVKALQDTYDTLNKKSYHLKDMTAEMCALDEKKTEMTESGEVPLDMFLALANEVDTTYADGSEEKKDANKMMRVILALFKEARTNKELREWLVKFFTSTKNYYDIKEKRSELKQEIRILNKLYDEQETKQQMASLKQKQAERRVDVKRKGNPDEREKKSCSAFHEYALKKQKN